MTSAPATLEDPGAAAMSVPLSPRQQAQQTRRQLRAQRYEDADAELREALDLAAEFAGMVRKQVAVPLTEWLV